MIKWHRSSYCDSANSCVEVAKDGSVVLVRDSKLGDDSPVQEWTVEEWQFLLDAIELGLPRFSGYLNLPDGRWRLGWARLGHDPLWFTADEWDAFVKGVRDGEFDQQRLSGPASPAHDAGRVVEPNPAGSDQAATGADITGRDTAPVAVELPGWVEHQIHLAAEDSPVGRYPLTGSEVDLIATAGQPGSEQAGTGHLTPDPVPAAAQTEADLLEMAWCLIANADVRTLDERDDEWAAAARKWRDGYHQWLSAYCAKVWTEAVAPLVPTDGAS